MTVTVFVSDLPIPAMNHHLAALVNGYLARSLDGVPLSWENRGSFFFSLPPNCPGALVRNYVLIFAFAH
jgi:hypothetical protein